jgi:Beta-galactosidase jelly roll domain
MILSFKRIDDLGWVYVNSKQVGVTTDWSQSYSFDVTKELHPGRNIIAVVVQNIGGGGGIGKPELNAALEKPAGQAVALRLFGRPTGDEKEWWAPDFNDKDWTSVPMDETRRRDNPMLTWYRMDFSLPSQQTGVWVPWRLHLMAHGNGFLCLNGHPLGRYWDVGPQHDFFLPECWLHFGGSNNLTLNLRPTERGAGIQSAEVKPYDDFAEKR